jgi:hypothetical protein
MVRNDTTASAGGSTTQVQYNNAGVLAGSANMTFNGTILTAHTLDASTGGVVFPDNTTQTTAAAPAGSDTQVQFNDGGAFGGDAGMVFNKSTNALTLTGPLTAVGGTLSSTLTMSAAAINGAIRVDVASATTCAIGAAASNYVRITGTTTITGLGTVASGIYRDVVFAGALTLTYNATSLILPTGANITTAAGDTAGFVSEGSGNWRCLWYSRASGTALSESTTYAEYTTYATLTTTIPSDDTIPQVTEGSQILSVAITPKSATSKVRVLVQAPIGLGSGGSPDTACMALFRNGSANAIASMFLRLVDGSSTYPAVILFEDTPGAATAQTYTVRVGANTANVNVNGVASGRLGGGSSRASITLTELS